MFQVVEGCKEVWVSWVNGLRRGFKSFGYGFWCHNELFRHRESSDPRKLVPCHVLCSCVSVSVSASFPIL